MDNLPLDDFPALSFSFDERANALFAAWLALAQTQTPHRLNADKSRVYQPADDVRRTFLQAWQSIAEKQAEEWHGQGWCQGFLMGFVGSNLSVFWSGAFLDPNVAQRNAHWLQAMVLYLDSYPPALLHVNRLYHRILDNDGTPPVFLPDEDELTVRHLVSDLQAEANWLGHKSYVESHILADITKAVESEKGVELPSIDDYFTSANLVELVNLNPYL